VRAEGWVLIIADSVAGPVLRQHRARSS